MKKSRWIFSLFAVSSVTIFGVIAQRSLAQSGENTHPLVRDVRIVPAPITELLNAQEDLTIAPLQASRDWQPIIRSAGIQPDSEKCIDCHFEGQSPIQAHSGNHLHLHAPDVFGCILCHGGNAQATEMKAAHSSTEVFPFMRGRQIEANCGKCHTEPAVPGAHSLSGGRFVLNRYGCITCHNLPVEIPTARYTPRLDYIGNKVTREWLEQWLEEPTVYLPKSKMPKIEGVSTSERDAIIEFLLTLRADALFQPITGQGNPGNGAKLFTEGECQLCHAVQGIGDKIGPALDRVGEKVNRLWLMNYLRKPAKFHPNTKMPEYQFSDQAILDLTAYLLTHFSNRAAILEKFPTVSSNSAKAREGFRLYITKGCAQCHGITRYMKVQVTEQIREIEIHEVIERIQTHRGEGLEVPRINIPASDLELMKTALLAMQRNDLYKKLAYNLAEGTLGNTNQFLESFWQFPIPFQGEIPDYYNETVAKLSPESCGSCHVKQWEDWKATRHAMAMGPGVWGGLIGGTPDFVTSCSECHVPLSEQHEYLPTSDGGYAENQQYEAQLQSHGITCAACHLRGHQRFGPSFSETAAASVFGEGHHGGAVVSPAYQDSAFCRSCHQFEEGEASLNGKLLENTYNEWLQSPHAKNGETCQSCHMPERRHRFQGIHDPEMVRKAVKLNVQMKNQRDRIEAEIQLTNEGAGHHLPTYAAPAIFVTVRLLDSAGNPIPKTKQVRAIQRRVPSSRDREIFDTRIPAGGTWIYDYKIFRPEHAETLEIRIDVHPDHFYNGFFKVHRVNRRAQPYIDEALEIIKQSPYLLLTKHLPLDAFPPQETATQFLETAESYNNLGIAYQKQGKLKAAIEAFKMAISIDPNLAEAHVNLGNGYAMQGELDDALIAFKEAVRINPNLVEVYSHLGHIYSMQGRLDEAIVQYKNAIAINPDYVTAHYNLACAYSLKNEKTLAIETLQKAIMLDQKYIEMSKTDSDFDNIRESPKFQQLIDSVEH